MTAARYHRVEALTAAQRASLRPFVEQWLDRVLAAGPLGPDDRHSIESGIRRCYESAGKPWPGRVVWVPSPFVGVSAAAVADLSLRARRHASPAARWRRGRRIGGRAALAVAAALAGATVGGVRVHGTDVGGLPFGGEVDHWLGWVLGAVGGGYVAGRGLLEWLEERDADQERPAGGRWGPAARAIGHTHGLLHDATVRRAEQQIRDGVAPAVEAAVREGVRRPVDEAERPLLSIAAQYPDRRVHADPRTLLDPVRAAVRAAVGEPVGRGEPEPTLVCRSEVHRPHGTGSVVHLMWWHRHGGISMPAGVHAYAAATRVPFWPHDEFVIASEPPVELHRPIRPGVVGRRLHRADGPAVRWRDGTAGFVRDGAVDSTLRPFLPTDP
jgi:hypothetical protein